MSRVLPILFSTNMVRAILDNRKTVTRRKIDIDISNQFDVENDGKTVVAYIDQATGDSYNPAEMCRYKPGDILYVRETWNFVYDMDGNDQIVENTGRYIYCADDPMPFSEWIDTNTGEHKEYMPWRPSIHMPKKAAQIWLKVTDVRVERLQETTNPIKYPHGKDNTILREGFKRTCDFIDCWNSTIRKSDLAVYGWAANPWVWVIEFERCKKPEPCILKGMEPASDSRPCIGYQKSRVDDEPCEMCKGCRACDGEDPE